MTRVLIIGYGNPLRGDDCFGPALARRLQDNARNDAEESRCNPDDEIIARHQLTPELAEPVSRAECVVFIDAAGGGTPGEISLQALQTAASPPTRFTHHATPETLLAYAQSLYGACPSEAFLLSVSGENFGYGERLSETVANALERARSQLSQLLANQTPGGHVLQARAEQVTAG